MNKYFYENEALDTRLCFLNFIRKIWIIIVTTALFSVVFGLVYTLNIRVLNPIHEYEMVDEYYVEYEKDEEGNEVTGYNYATWENLADTDYFVNYIRERLSFDIERDELEDSIDATILSDTRLVTTTVISTSKEKTEEIHKYFAEAFLEFNNASKEIASVSRVKTGEEAHLILVDDRTRSAVLLGGIVGIIISSFLVYIYVIIDSSVYLPITLEKRTGLKTENYKGSLKLEGTEGIFEEKEETFLYVKAGAHNGTRVEKIIREAKEEGRPISKAYLLDMNKGLYKAYYAVKVFKKEKNK